MGDNEVWCPSNGSTLAWDEKLFVKDTLLKRSEQTATLAFAHILKLKFDSCPYYALCVSLRICKASEKFLILLSHFWQCLRVWKDCVWQFCVKGVSFYRVVVFHELWNMSYTDTSSFANLSTFWKLAKHSTFHKFWSHKGILMWP